MNPASIDQWFPVEQQRKYVSQLKGRVGITRRRAEYFVKLWAFLLLKQQQELGKLLQQPLTELDLPFGFVPCSHREAYELFYGQADRGSDRAAGMMIDKLVALGLIEKYFDGNTTCIRICSPLSNLDGSTQGGESIQLILDAFNPRTDTIPVASFWSRNYNWMNKKNTDVCHKVAQTLRSWASLYPTGMRVLRRCDTQHPVGFYVFYPVARESEKAFFLPPRKSLHATSENETDPIQIALSGDRNCTSVFIRGWQIDSPHNLPINVCQFLEDGKKTLIQMQADFPNLCDIYTLPIHPAQEQLASAVEFQKMSQDPQLSFYWMYMPVEKYLARDMELAVSLLKFD